MSFTLHVKISGLCMFVPELSGGSDDDPKGRMHVLMPATEGKGHPEHSSNSVEPHSVRLIYNDIFTADGSRNSHDSDIVSVPLEGTVLQFGRPDSRTAALRLAPSVVNICTPQRAGAKVNRLLIDDGPLPDLLTSRVVLDEGEALTYEPGAAWHYPEGAESIVEMASGLYWTLRIDSDDLTIAVAKGDPRVLRPVHVDESKQMWLEIYHVPRQELPPARPTPKPPAHNSQPDHFEAFHSMLGVPGRPRPHFRAPKMLDMPRLLGTSPYTCMLVRGAL